MQKKKTPLTLVLGAYSLCVCVKGVCGVTNGMCGCVRVTESWKSSFNNCQTPTHGNGFLTYAHVHTAVCCTSTLTQIESLGTGFNIARECVRARVRACVCVCLASPH